MTTKKFCRCVVCNKNLRNLAFDFCDEGFQPSDGLAFKTYGHYGSCEFDPMDGSYLEVVICDDCVRTLSSADKVYERFTEQYQWETKGEY